MIQIKSSGPHPAALEIQSQPAQIEGLPGWLRADQVLSNRFCSLQACAVPGAAVAAMARKFGLNDPSLLVAGAQE
jgi:hypothetical protein